MAKGGCKFLTRRGLLCAHCGRSPPMRLFSKADAILASLEQSVCWPCRARMNRSAARSARFTLALLANRCPRPQLTRNSSSNNGQLSSASISPSFVAVTAISASPDFKNPNISATVPRGLQIGSFAVCRHGEISPVGVPETREPRSGRLPWGSLPARAFQPDQLNHDVRSQIFLSNFLDQEASSESLALDGGLANCGAPPPAPHHDIDQRKRKDKYNRLAPEPSPRTVDGAGPQ
jgi:hypothetical protein